MCFVFQKNEEINRFEDMEIPVCNNSLAEICHCGSCFVYSLVFLLFNRKRTTQNRILTRRNDPLWSPNGTTRKKNRFRTTPNWNRYNFITLVRSGLKREGF